MTLHKPQMLLIGAALAATAATLFIPVAAHATDIEETSSITVRFSDLNLDSQDGVHHLYLRLKLAAQSVCGDEHDAIDLRERGDIERCQQTAIEHAVEHVNRPLLTSLYDRRYPHEPAMVSASLSSASRG